MLNFAKTYFWEGVFCCAVALVITFVAPDEWSPPRLVRTAIKTVIPAWVDPPYENVAKIEIGMTRGEVHRLLGSPDPNGFRVGSRIAGFSEDYWDGTEGTIVVHYQARGAGDIQELIVSGKYKTQ